MQFKFCIDHIFLKTNGKIYEQIMPFVIQTDITDQFTTGIEIVIVDPQTEESYELQSKCFINDDKLCSELYNIKGLTNTKITI